MENKLTVEISEKRGRGRPKKYNTEEDRLAAKKAQKKASSLRLHSHLCVSSYPSIDTCCLCHQKGLKYNEVVVWDFRDNTDPESKFKTFMDKLIFNLRQLPDFRMSMLNKYKDLIEYIELTFYNNKVNVKYFDQVNRESSEENI